MGRGEGGGGGGEDCVLRRLRANKKVSTYDEVGAALESILDYSAFSIPPSSIPENIRQFFGRKNASNGWWLPKSIFSKVVGRIFPRPLRSYLYKSHLMRGGKKDFKALVNDAAAEKGLLNPWNISSEVDDSSYLSVFLKAAIKESLPNFDREMFEKTRRVLKMFHTLTGKERSELSYVVLPFMWNFESLGEYEIVGLLKSFERDHLSLPTSEVAAAAQTLLATLDPNLHSHLGNTLVENTKSAISSSFNSGGKKIEELFRRMVDTAFVSLLNRTQLEFVWDHNFLVGWRESCCALFCVDILFLHRKRLMRFNGGVMECLSLMNRNKNNILTSQLMERFGYYKEKGLVPDIDLEVWGDGDEKRRVKKLPLLFNFKDENFKPIEASMFVKESPR